MQNCQAGNGTVDEKSLPDEIKDYLGHILFSHINGPGNFYVRMQYKEYDNAIDENTDKNIYVAVIRLQ